MLLHGFTAIQDQIKEAESFLKEMPDAVYQVVKINEVHSVALTPPLVLHCATAVPGSTVFTVPSSFLPPHPSVVDTKAAHWPSARIASRT